MQPNESIVALAKKFHEYGGTKGIEINYGRWYVDSGLKNPCLWGELNPLISEECYPILDESELWAWFESQINSNIKNGREILDIDIRRLSVDSKLHVCVNTIGNSPYSVKTEHFDLSNGLRTALYAACVWVAKEKA